MGHRHGMRLNNAMIIDKDSDGCTAQTQGGRHLHATVVSLHMNEVVTNVASLF
jgi:hypothetical protein